jgi:transcriptional regulator with XRE-family HTH domain
MTSTIGANIKRLREERGWSQGRLAREVCRAAGISGDAIGRQEISRYETGKRTPREWLPFIAQAFGVSIADLKTPQSPTRAPLPLSTLNDQRGDDYAHTIREMSQRLIVLDNQMPGLPIADIAARSFKAVHRRLGDGDYKPAYERDIQSAAAELAEIAGWSLAHEGQLGAARRFSQEALFLARLAGDRSTELITLQNMGMLAGWVGRPREELAIARSVLDRGRLSPRVEAMFCAREAQGLAGSGQAQESARAFARAHSLLQDGAPSDEPHWAWWVTQCQVNMQHGAVLHAAGQYPDAVPVLEQAQRQDVQIGYHTYPSVLLLNSLLELKAWRDAESEAVRLVPVVCEIVGATSLSVLGEAASKGNSLSSAPSSLRDVLHRIGTMMREDPYEICVKGEAKPSDDSSLYAVMAKELKRRPY